MSVDFALLLTYSPGQSWMSWRQPPARCVPLTQQRTPQNFTRVVLVRNLPRYASEAEDLKKFFADCGEIADMCVGACKPPAVCCAQHTQAAPALRALQATPRALQPADRRLLHEAVNKGTDTVMAHVGFWGGEAAAAAVAKSGQLFGGHAVHVSATQDRSVELAALRASRKLDEQRMLGVSGIPLVRPSLEPQAPNVLLLP